MNDSDKKAVLGDAFYRYIRNLYTKTKRIKGEVTANADFHGLPVYILYSFCALFFVLHVTSLLTNLGNEICCK